MTSSKRKSHKKGKCAYCLSTLELTIDHKIPLIKNGEDKPSNFQTLCKRCNGLKSSYTHKRIKQLFHWFEDVRSKRIAVGKRPFMNKEQRLNWKKNNPPTH